jgi:hypothetical protein
MQQQSIWQDLGDTWSEEGLQGRAILVAVCVAMMPYILLRSFIEVLLRIEDGWVAVLFSLIMYGIVFYVWARGGG